MFTGIITDIGTIDTIEKRGDMRVRIITAYDVAGVDIGASIACSGVCLTVVDKGVGVDKSVGVDKGAGWFAVDVSGETRARTAGGQWVVGRRLNLERALKVGDELGGHIVTGHVDGVATVTDIAPDGDSRRVSFALPSSLAAYVAAKGSITVDGVSLTVNTVADDADGTVFSINIIPHTATETSLGALAVGQGVNVEIDVLARYLGRMTELRTQA